MKFQRKEMVDNHPFSQLPPPDGKSEPVERFELMWEDANGSVCIPILDDSQVAYLKKREENEKQGIKYWDACADLPEEKKQRELYDEHLLLKNKWRDSVLSFKHKDAVFQRYDGEFFERSFEPCVAGRIYEYPKMIQGKPYLVFQTDRGWWSVPCKSPKHLKRMVSSFKPVGLETCPNINRKFKQSMKEHGGAFFDKITGLPPGTKIDRRSNTFELLDEPGVVVFGADEYWVEVIDFSDPYWSEPTPWEVSCA